jgi:hypothetical protein
MEMRRTRFGSRILAAGGRNVDDRDRGGRTRAPRFTARIRAARADCGWLTPGIRR